MNSQMKEMKMKVVGLKLVLIAALFAPLLAHAAESTDAKKTPPTSPPAAASTASPTAPAQPQRFILSLDVNELQMIGDALGAVPYKASAPVIDDMNRQLNAQLNAQQPKPEADKAPPKPK